MIRVVLPLRPALGEEALRWGAEGRETSSACDLSSGEVGVVMVSRWQAFLGEGKGCKSALPP